jgi:hypothetical protein
MHNKADDGRFAKYQLSDGSSPSFHGFHQRNSLKIYDIFEKSISGQDY